MSALEEEARALEYRLSLERRAAATQRRCDALAGSVSARLALETRFKPLIDWAAERYENEQEHQDTGQGECGKPLVN